MRRWLARLLATSFTNPEQAAAEVLALGLSGAEVFLAALLVAVVLTLLNWLVGVLIPVPADPVQEFIRQRPLLAAAIQLSGIGLGALISLGLARLFGGTGSLRDTIMVSIWLSSVMALVQVALIVISPLIYPVLPVLLFGALIWSLYAYASAMVQVHGFRNVWLVMGVILLLTVVFVVVLAVLAIWAGFVPAGAL